MKGYIALVASFLSLNSFSQTVFSVYDHEGNPLSGAHVFYSPVGSNSEYVVLTDKNGKAGPEQTLIEGYGILIIRITFIGFEEYRDTIKTGASVSFRLKLNSFALNQMVVTAQYGSGTMASSVPKVKVIDRQRIESQGAVNLEDVLRNETNLRISQDNILGSGLSMQGISGQNVKILIDGVPVTGRLNGNIDLSQINLNNVERIEVVEGPLSVNYGTDALAGTINLITRKPESGTITGQVNTYYESNGQYNTDAASGYGFNNHSIEISGGRNYFDGWSQDEAFMSFPKKQLADSGRFLQWKPKEQYFAKLQYAYRWKELSIRPYVEYFEETVVNRGLPRLPYNETAFDDRYVTNRVNLGIEASGKLSEGKNITFLAAGNDYERTKNTWLKDLTTLQEQLTDNASDQDTAEFHLLMSRMSYSVGKDSSKIAYELGYDVSRERAAGRRIAEREKTMGDYALFSTAEIRMIRHLVVKPGLRYTYNTIYKAPLIPSLHFKYDLKRYTFRASYAKGFRAPSLKELYFDFVDINHNIHGSTGLKAERSDNYQVNASWQQTGVKRNIRLESGVYFNHIYDLITLAQQGTGQEYVYINVGTYKTIGFQANAERNTKELKVSVGAAYVGRYNAISEDLPVNSYSYSPEFRAGIIRDLEHLKMSLGLFYKYTGVLPGYFLNENNETVRSETADYHTLDVSCTRYFLKKRLQFTIGGKNLANVSNVTLSTPSSGTHSSGSSSVPVGRGRSMFMSFRFNFKKS